MTSLCMALAFVTQLISLIVTRFAPSVYGMWEYYKLLVSHCCFIHKYECMEKRKRVHSGYLEFTNNQQEFDDFERIF